MFSLNNLFIIGIGMYYINFGYNVMQLYKINTSVYNKHGKWHKNRHSYKIVYHF